MTVKQFTVGLVAPVQGPQLVKPQSCVIVSMQFSTIIIVIVGESSGSR